jgi:hypothetical protein
MKIGDEVTVAGVIVDITASGNAVVKTKHGVKFLVQASEIKTIRPKMKECKEDKRKGN